MAELTPGQIACAGYCWGEELERFLEQIPKGGWYFARRGTIRRDVPSWETGFIVCPITAAARKGGLGGYRSVHWSYAAEEMGMDEHLAGLVQRAADHDEGDLDCPEEIAVRERLVEVLQPVWYGEEEVIK